MANRDDKLYCALLTELVKNSEREIERKLHEYKGYVKQKEEEGEEENARIEASKMKHNEQLRELKQSYDKIVKKTEVELDTHLNEHTTRMEEALQRKMNNALAIFEKALQDDLDKLIEENAALQQEYEREWYEVDNMKKDLLKINMDIERYSKDTDNDAEIVAALQYHIGQIKHKNEEITRMYDRLYQNLQNKISHIEDDINRMQQLCNNLSSDDASNVKSTDENETSDVLDESIEEARGNTSENMNTSVSH